MGRTLKFGFQGPGRGQNRPKEPIMRGEIYHRGPWQIPYKAKVLCSDGKWRTAITSSEPDLCFSLPARVRVKGTTVSGYVMVDTIRFDEPTYIFMQYNDRKNYNALPK